MNPLMQLLRKWSPRLKTKAKKTYPPKKGLIFYYDDLSRFFRGDDFNQIRDVCEKMSAAWPETFDALFVVGIKNDQPIEYWMQNK
jgi:hypothetical protein